jgi:hypothetical protein
MKFKLKIIILSVSIVALSAGFMLISQNTAYGGIGPGIFTGLSANPASTIGFKGTQYAIVVEPGTSDTVKTIVVTFPLDTTLQQPQTKVSVATLDDVVLTGTTFSDDTAKTVTFTLDTPTLMGPGDKLFLLIQKVRNPTVVGNISASLTVETFDLIGDPVDGPTSLGYGIQEVLTPGGPALRVDNTNFKVGIGNNVTPDETLTVVGNIKLSGNIVSSGPINIIPTGDICIGTGCT